MVSASPSISMHSSLHLLQPSTMPAGEKHAPKRLKIKLSKVSSESEIVSAEVGKSSQVFPTVLKEDSFKTSANNCSDAAGLPYSYDFKEHFSSSRGGVLTTTFKEKRLINKFKLSKNSSDLHDDGKMVVSERYNMQGSGNCSSKRGPVMKLDNLNAKKQKIDSRVLPQCTALLKKLMTSPYGWVFNQPVDPEKLQIPDYFSVISEPMDLGTIKSKLDKKLYLSAEEFAADVRLTFSNAMKYNPPSNDVHIMAKKLNDLFESRWKSIEPKSSTSCLKTGSQPSSIERPIKTIDLRRDSHGTQISCPKTSKKVVIKSLDSKKLRNDLVEKCAEFSNTQSGCGRDSLQKDLHRGISSIIRLPSGSMSDKSRGSSSCINSSCESLNSRCSQQSDFPSDLTSDRSSGKDNKDAGRAAVNNLDIPVNHTSSRHPIKSDLDSDGGCNILDEENVDLNSHPRTPGTAHASEEGFENNIYDAHLSPTKALRAAMLMGRFADTIVKAKQKTLLNNGHQIDPVKMKQEKERLEKQQREERARIEAKIKAAEAASRMKEEMELKKQREREREAARIEIEKMERSVEIYENMEILKDLEMLGGYVRPDYSLLNKESPLERLGLVFKDKYLEDEEEIEEQCNGSVVADEQHEGDVEEGEIAS